MNKNEILNELNLIAEQLDDQNMVKEANEITNVMTRIAQMPFQTMQAPNTYNPLAPVDLRPKMPAGPYVPNSAPTNPAPQNIAAPESMQSFLNNQGLVQQTPNKEQELIKRYLGWAFHAITAKNVSVKDAKEALINHIKNNGHSIQFIMDVETAFDRQIANQKALQGR